MVNRVGWKPPAPSFYGSNTSKGFRNHAYCLDSSVKNAGKVSDEPMRDKNANQWVLEISKTTFLEQGLSWQISKMEVHRSEVK